jgi:hypothetical protein
VIHGRDRAVSLRQILNFYQCIPPAEIRPGKSAGQFQTNVYTKKRRKLKITWSLRRRVILRPRGRAATFSIGPLLDAGIREAVAELVRRTVSQYHPQQS